MKKLVCLAVGAACACFAASSSFAAGSGMEVHGLYAFSFNDDANVDNTFGGGASFVFSLSPNIKLDLGGDYFKPEDKDSSDAKVQFIPVCAALRIGGNLESIFLYVGGGAGYSFNSADIKGVNSSDADFENSMIYFACGGAEFGLSDSVYIRGEFRYNWLKPEFKIKSLDYSEDINFDHMQVRAGLGFNF